MIEPSGCARFQPLDEWLERFDRCVEVSKSQLEQAEPSVRELLPVRLHSDDVHRLRRFADVRPRGLLVSLRRLDPRELEEAVGEVRKMDCFSRECSAFTGQSAGGGPLTSALCVVRERMQTVGEYADRALFACLSDNVRRELVATFGLIEPQRCDGSPDEVTWIVLQDATSLSE